MNILEMFQKIANDPLSKNKERLEAFAQLLWAREPRDQSEELLFKAVAHIAACLAMIVKDEEC